MKIPNKFLCVLALVTQLPLAASAQPAQSYVWRAVAMGGGGFVDGIVVHPTEKNLMYARTDVGGAYRWDDKKQEWIPLTDWLSPAEGNFTGIESIALDPSDPNRLYLAAGTYASGPAAILRSDDQGRTFQYSEVPFRMGGNADGRSNGERLAVDPNENTILFFGSRSTGLWKSTDRAVSWKLVESFPASVMAQPAGGAGVGRRVGGQSAGIVSVVFDAFSGKNGSLTPVIYAAAAVTGTNFFRSDDAGMTWHAVANQSVGMRPNHVIQSPDGFLYLTYGNVPGPNDVTDGAVWKYSPKDGSWANISPEKPAEGQRLGWGYGAVSVDLKHTETVVVTTIDRWSKKDEVFRSTDGGATWKGILVDNGRLDNSMAPYTAQGHTPHWTGSVAINPNNPDQILLGTGYGIWASTNASTVDSGKPVTWIFLDQGLEETVPLALISPPAGAHLISGVGDIDGFRHDDVEISPPQGTFAGPRFSSTRDIAYAGSRPEVMIRIGNGGKGINAHIAISSEDGGTTWRAFGSDPPGGTGGTGTLALSADGSTIVWTVQHGAVNVSTNVGETWAACAGISGGIKVVADPVNPLKFYAYDAPAGKLLVSTNGAMSFEATTASLPAVQGGGRGGGGGGILAATFGMEGDLWVGPRTGGLYHSTDGGISFTKLDNVAGAEALGFGKAAPGKTFPALYLLGTIKQLHARYRSDDAGQTWVRIDDDQHQFANANVPMIIGDPRIYGRVYFTTGGRGVIYGDINNGPASGKK